MTKVYRILIVDDDFSVIEILQEKLISEKFDVISANDGIDGLKKSLKEKPDLILLDLLMPSGDGLTMLRELRKDEWGKEVPVMVLTNLEDNQKIAEIIKEGAFDYLIKTDWKISDIVAKIKKKLGTA